MSKVEFYYCKSCNSVFYKVYGEKGTEVCTNDGFKLLTAGSTDAAQEKHVPVVVRNGNKAEVTVGSTEHPMTDEHFITMIAVVQNDDVYLKNLKPGEKPQATFEVGSGPIEVYEYCNKHGLWCTEA